jgi:tRNA (cmo5U34)-methyltransferase
MNIAHLFDASAPHYDRVRRKLVPRFDDFYGTVINLVPCEKESSFTFLDVGAGTGLLAEMILKAFPASHAILLDISEGMLHQARERLTAFSGRVETIAADYANDGSAPLGSCDLAVSALSIHHTPAEKLESVFAKIFAAMRSGGHFINADQVLGETPAEEERYDREWMRHVRASGCTTTEIADARKRMTADKTAPLGTQLDALSAAGFLEVLCSYQQFRFAVYSGRKGRP